MADETDVQRMARGAWPVSGEMTVGPHEFQRRRGSRFWICAHCYAPKKLHPRTGWVKARPLYDNQFISADAPHFREGW